MYNIKKLFNFPCSIQLIQLYNNKVYYIATGESKLHQIDLDGTNDKTLNFNCVAFYIINDTIYYSHSNYLYKANIDGTNVKRLCSADGFSLHVENNVIYFRNDSIGYKLCKINTDGTGYTILSNISIRELTVSNNVIYFRENTSKKIYKINTDGTRLINIFDGSNNGNIDPQNLLFVNNSLYFNDVTNYRLCKIDNYGYNLEIIYNNKLLYDLAYYNNKIYAHDISDNCLSEISLNSIPTISDIDRDLGNKNTGFNINYTVSDADNNNLTVTEKLNGNILRTLNNAPRNQELFITINNEMLYKLPLNKQNTITIEVNDNNGGIAFRNYTFTRTNTAPIISDSNRDLGVVDRNIKQTYTTHDEEGNSISVTEKLDNIVLKSFIAEDNKEYIISIPEKNWITLPNGKHTLTITATDSNNATSIRTYTFIKKENKIVLELKKPFSTDAKANKILITPVWQNIDKANVKVEVCNNALDSEKTWEDATKEVLSNNKYSFKNNNKVSEKWGINIKFTIEKKEGVEEEIYFNGFGGAFE